MTHTRTLIAFNTATASENKIHDDAVASRFGFTGGLVPGVDVFAYLAHAPMAAWGKDWLAGGQMRARFTRPVYDGDLTTVESEADGVDGIVMRVQARGEACAAGSARRTGAPAPAQLLGVAEMPAMETRPKASLGSLKVGATIGILLPFSRNNELEADKLGVDYMHTAGYDVKQSVRLWEKMGAASTDRPTEWMSTHPNPETRIAELRSYITAKGYATF